jgi:hypothetical protein
LASSHVNGPNRITKADSRGDDLCSAFVTVVRIFPGTGQATEDSATATGRAQPQVAQFEFWLQIARGDRTVLAIP